MSNILRYSGQAFVYACMAAVLGYFANSPTYENFPADKAELKISFAHGGARTVECHRRSAAELRKLAPNMRKPMDCPRERVPLFIQLSLDEDVIFDGSLTPTGLSHDGPSRIYEKFQVSPGSHVLVAKLRDSRRDKGFDYVRRLDLNFHPREIVALDFRAELGGFVVRK